MKIKSVAFLQQYDLELIKIILAYYQHLRYFYHKIIFSTDDNDRNFLLAVCKSTDIRINSNYRNVMLALSCNLE